MVSIVLSETEWCVKERQTKELRAAGQTVNGVEFTQWIVMEVQKSEFVESRPERFPRNGRKLLMEQNLKFKTFAHKNYS